MKPDLCTPADLARDTPPALSGYGWRLLAEGDSWFSLTATGRYGPSLLQELRLPRSALIVNCAAPGHTLQRMVDRRADGSCQRLLCAPRLAYAWDAVLLSAGGNDFIAAAATPLAEGIAATGISSALPSCTTMAQMRSSTLSCFSLVRRRIQLFWRKRRGRAAG